MDLIRALWVGDEGQDLVEYGLIAVLISTALIATLQSFAQPLLVMWNKIAATVSA